MMPSWAASDGAHAATSVTIPGTDPNPGYFMGHSQLGDSAAFSQPGFSASPGPSLNIPEHRWFGALNAESTPGQPDFGSPQPHGTRPAADRGTSHQAAQASPSTTHLTPDASPSGKRMQNFNAQPSQPSWAASTQQGMESSHSSSHQAHQQASVQFPQNASGASASNAITRHQSLDPGFTSPQQVSRQVSAPSTMFKQPASGPKGSKEPHQNREQAMSRQQQLQSPAMSISRNPSEQPSGRAIANMEDISFKRPRSSEPAREPSRTQSMAPLPDESSAAAGQLSGPGTGSSRTPGPKYVPGRQSSSLFDASPGPMLTYPVVPLDAVDMATLDISNMLQAQNQDAEAQSTDNQAADKQDGRGGLQKADMQKQEDMEAEREASDAMEADGGNGQDGWAGFQSPPRQHGAAGLQQRTAAEPMQESPESSHAGSGTSSSDLPL